MLLTSLSTFLILLASFVATLILAIIINKKIAPSQLRSCFLATMSCLYNSRLFLICQYVFAIFY